MNENRKRRDRKPGALLTAVFFLAVPVLAQTTEEYQGANVRAYRGAGFSLKAGYLDNDEGDSSGGFYFQPWSWYPFYPFLAPWGFCWSSGYLQSLWDEKETTGSGEVVLPDIPSGAFVFVDGVFAGWADDLATMSLRPGRHRFRFEIAGQEALEAEVDVVQGKRVNVSP